MDCIAYKLGNDLRMLVISCDDTERELLESQTGKSVSLAIRPTPVAADGAVAPIKCAECGDEILPICEACAGDMRRR